MHRVKDFGFLCCGIGLGMHRQMEGNRTKSADPKWLKKYSIPSDVILNNKTRESGLGELLLLGDWLGISWLVVNNCIVHHCLLLLLLLLLFFIFTLLLHCPCLNWWTDEFLHLYLVLILFPISLQGSEQMAVWYFASSQVKPQHRVISDVRILILQSMYKRYKTSHFWDTYLLCCLNITPKGFNGKL